MISTSLLFLGGLGPWEFMAIIAVILLLFGGKKIPELAKGLGKGLKEFRNATKDEDPSKSPEKNSDSTE